MNLRIFNKANKRGRVMRSRCSYSNFYLNRNLDTKKFPNKIHYKLINPEGEVIAG